MYAHKCGEWYLYRSPCPLWSHSYPAPYTPTFNHKWPSECQSMGTLLIDGFSQWTWLTAERKKKKFYSTALEELLCDSDHFSTWSPNTLIMIRLTVSQLSKAVDQWTGFDRIYMCRRERWWLVGEMTQELYVADSTVLFTAAIYAQKLNLVQSCNFETSTSCSFPND